MANAIEKVNGIAIADIQAINGKTDDNIQALNALEFTGVTDARTLIEEQVAFTDETTVSFDSLGGTTYNALMFQLINIHPDTDDVQFRFASSVSDDYQLATFLEFKQNETGTTGGAVQYAADYDTLLNANTNIANIGRGLGGSTSNPTESLSGYLYIYGLNNAPFAHSKQWYTSTSMHAQFDWHLHTQNGGFIAHDGTSGSDAITQIDFTMSSGTFDGTIRLFGMALA